MHVVSIYANLLERKKESVYIRKEFHSFSLPSPSPSSDLKVSNFISINLFNRLFTDTTAILNYFDLRSIMGCPRGMSTIRCTRLVLEIWLSL